MNILDLRLVNLAYFLFLPLGRGRYAGGQARGKALTKTMAQDMAYVLRSSSKCILLIKLYKYPAEFGLGPLALKWSLS